MLKFVILHHRLTTKLSLYVAAPTLAENLELFLRTSENSFYGKSVKLNASNKISIGET